MERPRGASEEEDGGSGIDENGEDPNAADLRAVLEQIRLNASTSPSACPLGPSIGGRVCVFHHGACHPTARDATATH
jgi:hypothetical protein